MIWLLLSILGIGLIGGAASKRYEPDLNNENSQSDEQHSPFDSMVEDNDYDDDGDMGSHNGSMGDGNHSDQSDHSSDHDDSQSDDTGSNHDGNQGHGGHHDHPDIALPQTPAEIAAFVEAIISQPDGHSHGDDSSLVSEHMALMDLVDKTEATHISIGNGSWFDPSNWHNGEVPGEGAKVLISYGTTLEYDAESEASLFTVRIDGALDFATQENSKMVVDTMVVSPIGSLTVGTEEEPVADDVTAEIVIANNGAIDVDWDPSLLSRGLISHGEVSIHGQIKDSHEKVIDHPLKGDVSLEFDELPVGWEVGDKLVIAGTNYIGHYGIVPNSTYEGSEDEIRIISKIEGSEVFFDTPLEFDHVSPRADLFTSVANYSRNVIIGTEDADTAEVFERGHVMFMHSNNVDVRYAEFHELGRTDKSEVAVDADEVANIAFDTNVKGRYGLHLHRTGTDDLDNPAIVVGNAVFGSPGWGFVHHDSNAILDNNASFNTFGAGFVSESGNETGVWSDNIAILAEGNDIRGPKQQSDPSEFDTARSGDGFWSQSRLVEIVDNVAASVNHGFVFYHRGTIADDGQILFDSENFAFPEALLFEDGELPDRAPILAFEGNETFASKEGLHVVKGNPDQQHDVRTVLSDFTAWNVLSGAKFGYTGHYLLNNFDLIGADDDSLRQAKSFGIEFGTNSYDMTVLDAQIASFDVGIELQKKFSIEGPTEDLVEFHVIDTSFSDVQDMFIDYDPELDVVASVDELSGSEPQLFFEGPFTYSTQDPYILITGTKSDSLGTTDFPNGLTEIKVRGSDIKELLAEKGYYTTTEGQNALVLDVHFSDRLTGEVFKQPTVIRLAEDVSIGSDVELNGTLTAQELQELGAQEATKVEYTPQHETIDANGLYNLEAHENWDAYAAITNAQQTHSEEMNAGHAEDETNEHVELV